MSTNTVEWMAVGLFFACYFIFSIIESGWLNKANGIPFGKAFAFSFATNTLSITIGFFISFVIFGVLLALAWDGTLGRMSGNDWRIWAASLAGAFFPLALLILAKRLGLKLFKMETVGLPWLFATAASVVFLLFVTAVPVLFVYFA